MELFFYTVLLYLYIPTILGAIRWQANTAGFSHEKNLLRYISNHFRFSNTDIRFISTLILIFIILLPSLLYSMYINSGNNLCKLLIAASVVLTALSSTIYALTSASVKANFDRYKAYWTLVITGVGAFSASKAASFAESLITNIVDVRASDLPTSQIRLSVIMAPVAWVFTLSIIFILIYAVVLFTSVAKNSQNPKTFLRTPYVKINHRTLKNAMTGISIAISFAMIPVSYLNILELVLKSKYMEKFVREQIVDASFHTPASICGIKGIKNALVSRIADDKAILALPDKHLSYRFQAIKCAKNWTSIEDIQKPAG